MAETAIIIWAVVAVAFGVIGLLIVLATLGLTVQAYPDQPASWPMAIIPPLGATLSGAALGGLAAFLFSPYMTGPGGPATGMAAITLGLAAALGMATATASAFFVLGGAVALLSGSARASAPWLPRAVGVAGVLSLLALVADLV